jgi:Cu2+-exporting ATPase
MTRLRQTGIVLTRSDALLQIARVNAALFDKTGTLTEHAPDLVDVELLTEVGVDRDGLLDIAAALQRHANHPLARAFPEPKRAVVNDVRVIAGAGVEGRWQNREVKIGSGAFCGLPTSVAETGIFLALDGTPTARFEIADPLRPDAQPAIEALRRAGIRSTMVSGDAADRCAALATQLHIDYVARQAPETKLEITRALQTGGARVMVVGDGINDVPALAAADVSVAVLESSDLVKSRTDVLLLSRRLGALVDLVVVGRQAAGVIRQNLAWALSYNLVAIPFAALGFMPPWVAALGMASSSTLVMLNATRLLRVPAWRPPEDSVQNQEPIR